MSNEYLDWKCDDLLEKAYAFANEKHIGQIRKYTNEPYIVHPCSVSSIISTHMSNIEPLFAFSPLDVARIQAIALLHDTIEDTNTTYNEIEDEFGIYTRNIVYWLTNVSKPEMGYRAYRKKMDLQHILQAPVEAMCLKMADVIDNCKDIVQRELESNEPSTFAKRYLKEKLTFLKAIWKEKKTRLEPYAEILESENSVKAFQYNCWLKVFDSLYSECRNIVESQLKLVKD